MHKSPMQHMCVIVLLSMTPFQFAGHACIPTIYDQSQSYRLSINAFTPLVEQ